MISSLRPLPVYVEPDLEPGRRGVLSTTDRHARRCMAQRHADEDRKATAPPQEVRPRWG
jgi:hypothetical protein